MIGWFSVKVGNDPLSGSQDSIKLRGAMQCSLSSALHSAFGGGVQAKWNATEEKPAVVAIALSSFVAIWAAAGLVDAVKQAAADRRPAGGRGPGGIRLVHLP